MHQERQKTVVIGGGYVGALAAARMATRGGHRTEVTLVNPEPGFVQRLRLHQIATGQRVAAPELAGLCGRRVSQVRGRAEAVDLGRGVVQVRREDRRVDAVPYDTLLIATGSTVDTSAVAGVTEHAHTLSDAASARCLAAELEGAPEGARVAVVGAGLTGIEAVTEIAASRPDLRVSLVAREDPGRPFSPAGRAHLAAVLDRLGVEVRDGIEVQAITAGALEPADGPSLPFEVAVWCGGFTPRSLAADSGLTAGPRGGVLVDRHLRSVSHPEVLAAGDAANAPTLRNGAAVRMSCQAGIPMGVTAADVITASLRGRDEPEFDSGFIAWNISLGRKDGLIQWVDRADRPKEHVTHGRRAAGLKEVVTAGGAKGPAWMRRAPARMLSLPAGDQVAGPAPAGPAVRESS